MNLDQMLRSVAPDDTALRVETERIRGSVLDRLDDRFPTSRNAPRVRFVVASLAAALTVGGGVAYAASGTLPSFFRDSIGTTESQFGDDNVSDKMIQIVDLRLPDGTRFAAWRAVGEKLYCTAELDNWDGHAEPGDPGTGGTSCGTMNTSALNEINVAVVAGRISPPAEGTLLGFPKVWFPVIYGGTDSDATTVHITGTLNWTGRQVDVVLPIDPTSHVFAAVLPGAWHQSEFPAPISAEIGALEGAGPAGGLVLTFLDNKGKPLDRRPIAP